MIIAIGILVVVIIFLLIKLNKKIQIDTNERNQYDKEIQKLRIEKTKLSTELDNYSYNLCTVKNDLKEARDELTEIQNDIAQQTVNLDKYFNEQKVARQQALDSDIESQKRTRLEALELMLSASEKEYNSLTENAKKAAAQVIEELQQRIAQVQSQTDFEQQRYESLIAPIKQYEMERQQRLFYTIQVPEEYRDDIDFLLTNVASRVRHPDVINKLVYTEYIKPYLEDTFRRIEIKTEPGIYKITSLTNGKSYIGKSTNVKKRLADHFKAAVGLESIAWQAVHDEILKQGIWNWTIEIITYCEKDKLNELEKYYISFFDTVSSGYNKNAGGGG